MTPISKEEFMVILKHQQESGLSVKDFCFNLSENKPALKTVPSVNIIGEIKIKLPGVYFGLIVPLFSIKP